MADVDCAIVGAGISGLIAAKRLADAGISTMVFDKGRSVGGRLATRRIGEARLDHGAQFMTARSESFAAQLEDWQQRGLADIWCHGFESDDGHPRWIGVNGMNSLAKDLAKDIDVRVDHRVFSTTWEQNEWSVTCDDAQTVTASTLVLTAPIPQSFSFVFETVETLPRELWSADHDRTIALLAALDGPSALIGSGARHEPSDDIAFVVDHAVKGISPVPAITMNTSPEWSERFWDSPTDEIEAALSELIAPFLGSAHVVEQQVKKWRFATPRAAWSTPCWSDDDFQLVVAGDAFGGPRVEGAFLSGVAAAETITGWCTQRR
ncbi:MAG: FAD-binding protein [Actinobacteria bacterium]|nr:FAD-binding protein [Actinomycetota bacterium]